MQLFTFQVWDGLSDAQISFHHDQFSDELMYIIENDVILEALSSSLTENHRNVLVRYNSQIEVCNLKTNNTHAELSLKSGEKFSANMLVSKNIGFQLILLLIYSMISK